MASLAMCELQEWIFDSGAFDAFDGGFPWDMLDGDMNINNQQPLSVYET